MRFPLPAGAVLLALLSACAPPASEGTFDSPDPASQLFAMQRAIAAEDRTAIPHLIEALDSDDPAVRLVAIEGLRRLTGMDLGYRVFDPVEVRAVAVERWVQRARDEGWSSPDPTDGASAPPSNA